MKKIINTFIISICLTSSAFFTARAQPGSLDLSFSSDGKVTTDFSGFSDAASCIAIQNDGKIVVAGKSSNGSNADFAIVRYNTDGSLDLSFGTAGKTTTDFGGTNDYGLAVAIQSDGKIVVGGFTNGPTADFALVRYTMNGSLDTSFGTAGKVTTAVGISEDRINAIAIQSDGKIVASGVTVNASQEDFALVRYTTNGSLDNTFGSGGIVFTDFAGQNDYVRSIVIQSDGKIVVAGSIELGIGTYNDFGLARFTTSGALDNSFGIGGKVRTDFSYDDICFSLALQSDGKIVAAGTSGSPFYFTLARYTTNGTLDNTFGTNGMVITAGGITTGGYTGLAIQTDGKIILSGYTGTPPNRDFSLFCYNTNGSLANTFGNAGIVTTDFGGDDYAPSVAIQTDGKIVVAGAGFNDVAVARYNSDLVICNVTVYDTIYISVTDTLIINTLLMGVIPPNNINTLKIYPNPANTQIVIDNGNFSSMVGHTIKIDNTLGQTVFQNGITQQQFVINLSGWTGAGTYFVYIIDSNSNTIDVKKIILQ